jgi:hypothetical protein
MTAKKFKAIPMKMFGKDHWSLLSYIETCCVDNAHEGVGNFDYDRLRTNTDKHPWAIGKRESMSFGIMGQTYWKDEYSTRLKGYSQDRENPVLQPLGHDDVDCLDDLDAARLVEILTLTNCKIRITQKGMKFAAAIREHKTQGGNWAGFDYTDWFAKKDLEKMDKNPDSLVDEIASTISFSS